MLRFAQHDTASAPRHAADNVRVAFLWMRPPCMISASFALSCRILMSASGIAVDDQQVGVLAGLERADVLLACGCTRWRSSSSRRSPASASCRIATSVRSSSAFVAVRADAAVGAHRDAARPARDRRADAARCGPPSLLSSCAPTAAACCRAAFSAWRSTHTGATSVGTRNVPRRFISAMHSSSSQMPCSIDSTPAWTAFLMPCVPCACAMHVFPAAAPRTPSRRSLPA